MNKTSILMIAAILFASLLLFGGPSDEALKAAFEKGDSDAVLKLLAADPSLLKADLGGGQTPLHAAVTRGLETVFDAILAKGADINIKDGRGLTPAWYAVTGKQPAMLRKLIARGADLSIKDPSTGEDMLFRAASLGTAEVFSLLLDNGKSVWGAIPSEDVVGTAVRANAVEIIKVAAARGFDLRKGPSSGLPFLHTAAVAGKAEVLNYLLDQGTDINVKDSFRKGTALVWAVSMGQVASARDLTRRGADVNARDVIDATPLLLAVEKGYEDLVELFLSKGADPGVTDSRTGKTLLHFAAARGHSAIVETLLKRGLDKNAKDKNGRTALSYALEHGNRSAAGVLRRYGVQETGEKFADDSVLLSRPLGEGDAAIWYINNSGWVIRTKSALLVFDYWDNDAAPDEMLLANGHVRPDEIKDLPVYVFVTHGHFDHYDPRIFEWKKSIPNITYIFGFEPQAPDKYVFMAPHTQKAIGPLSITTTMANDEGVGFAVQVDGLTVFHSGDHMNFQPLGKDNVFTPEIDFLAERGLRADLLFLPTAWVAEDMELSQAGVFYAVDKLKAKAFFPMHGNNRESMYADWVGYAAKNNIKVQVGAAAAGPGDRFFFSKGKLTN